MIKRIIKALSFYPVVMVGGISLLVLRVVGWSCLAGCLLTGVYRGLGEFDVSWSIVGALGLGGMVALVGADLLLKSLDSLKLGEFDN